MEKSGSFIFCSLLFHVLLVIQCSANSITGASRKILAGVGKDHRRKHQDHGTHHMVDPSVNIFFSVDDLRIGKQLPVYFTVRDPSKSPRLLPRREADSIPFKSSELPYLLDLFSFSDGSPQAKAIGYTLRQCELQPIKGESKLCATSLESMVDFADSVLGSGFRVITTAFLSNHSSPLQNYTILEPPTEVPAAKVAACHTMPFPYAVYYCHTQSSLTRLFRVSLRGDNGEMVDAAAVCHMDSSHWNHDHVAFRLLGTRPGASSPVCHFLPADNLVWFRRSASVSGGGAVRRHDEFFV